LTGNVALDEPARELARGDVVLDGGQQVLECLPESLFDVGDQHRSGRRHPTAGISSMPRTATAASFRRIVPASDGAASTGGRSLNIMSGEDGSKQVSSAYDVKDYQRLTELKAAYDPANIFRLNHNIPPAVSEKPQDV
jgi:hypothetical protein